MDLSCTARVKSSARLCRERSCIVRRRQTQYRGSIRLANAILGFSLAMYVAAPPAHADVDVQGEIAFVRITANDAQVTEVLSALRSALGVRYRTSIPLQGSVSGTYRGSPGQVLTSSDEKEKSSS